MKRPTFVNSRLQDDIADAYSSTAPISGNTHIDGGVSPYMANDANLSDCDSYSDSSRRMRKKRNTYQKIPDDIRMQLLEAVQNGETLKSAAKRHRINYSSAKSILHTYRKEGRICKKSAQERTTKKRSLTNSDFEQPAKPTKQVKRESMKTTENDYPSSHFASSGQKIKSEATTNNSEEANFRNPKKVLVENSNTKFSTQKYESHGSDQPLTLPDNVHSAHKEDESTIRMLTIIENEHPTEVNHANDQNCKEENPTHKYKVFDNFYFNHHYETPAEHIFGEGTDYMNFSKDFDSYHEAATNAHRKISHHENDHHNMTFDDRNAFIGSGFDFEMSAPDPNCPFKSFMDTQRLLREALRKASFTSFNGKYGGYRKGSVDFI